MTALEAIAVQTEFETGNVKPLLHEIRHALLRLLQGEDGAIIDLRSLPLAPGEEKRIEEALGVGEVRVEIDALGPSSVTETNYPGVWLITHRNTENEIIARLIEVTEIPSILKSQPEDIQAGLAQLEKQLSGEPETATN